MSTSWRNKLHRLTKVIRNRLGRGWMIHTRWGTYPFMWYELEIIAPSREYGTKIKVTNELLNRPDKYSTIARMIKRAFDNAE